MRKRKTRAALSVFTALLLTVVLTVGVLPAQAFAVTQGEIDQLEKEKEEIEEKISEKQAVVDELEAQHASALERKKAMDERNEFTIRQIEINDKQIALYDELIEEKGEEVEEAKRLEEEQLERWQKRVRAMEENGSANILAMLLNVNSLGEFLTVIDDIGEIMKSDKMLEEAYIEARRNTEQVKADYEEYRGRLEEKKAELNAEKEELEKQLEEAEKLIEEILNDLDAESGELEELIQAEEQAQAVIDAKVAELEEQRRQEEEARRRREEEQSGGDTGTGSGGDSGNGGSSGGGGGGAVGSGSFWWPVSCTYITSVVGYRYHPISGEWKYHSGMDIGCQYGDAVSASDSGTVSLAGWNGGYGNCIIIDHGNGYYTLYGHLSSIGVSVGQTVSQGQYIGAVGSTGVSTGPHLHFEIRDASGPIDFSGWFGGLTYAPDSGG